MPTRRLAQLKNDIMDKVKKLAMTALVVIAVLYIVQRVTALKNIVYGA